MCLRSGKIFNVRGQTRLRSGRILAVMVNLKNASRGQNDTPGSEPPVTTTTSMAWTMNTIRVTGPILTPVLTSALMLGVMVSLP